MKRPNLATISRHRQTELKAASLATAGPKVVESDFAAADSDAPEPRKHRFV
jgi:hypothetical protein